MYCTPPASTEDPRLQEVTATGIMGMSGQFLVTAAGSDLQSDHSLGSESRAGVVDSGSCRCSPRGEPIQRGLPHPLLSFLPIQGHWTCWSAAASGGPPLLPLSLPRLCLAYARAQPGPWAGSSGGGTAPGGRPGLHVSAPPPPTSSHGGPKEARSASCLPWRPRDQAPWAVSDETSRRITAEGAGWEAGG